MTKREALDADILESIHALKQEIGTEIKNKTAIKEQFVMSKYVSVDGHIIVFDDISSTVWNYDLLVALTTQLKAQTDVIALLNIGDTRSPTVSGYLISDIIKEHVIRHKYLVACDKVELLSVMIRKCHSLLSEFARYKMKWESIKENENG